ncbi:MAG: biotin/lipoyl-containing protein, partial [Gammaproteobacteria bacterium]
RSGDEIGIFYDPMIAKISVSGKDRDDAVGKLRNALARTAVFGIVTNLPLLRGIARHPGFAAGAFDTGFIEHELEKLLARPPLSAPVVAAAVSDKLARLPDAGARTLWQADGWRLGAAPGWRLTARDASGAEHEVHIAGTTQAFGLKWNDCDHAVTAVKKDGSWIVSLDDKSYTACVLHYGADYQVALGDKAYGFTLASPFAPRGAAVADTATHPVSPMPGRVVTVHVKTGDKVEIGAPLMVLEGMKMEYTVKAGVAGRIEEVLYAEGDMVDAEAPLVNIEADA